MKEILIETKAFIKRKIGLCNAKGCYKKSIAEIKISHINLKRCLCKEHLEVFEKLFEEDDKKYELDKIKEKDIVIDHGVKEEEKTSFIKINREIKSKEEKQIEKLENLFKRVKKSRVKKKLIKRIDKLKNI